MESCSRAEVERNVVAVSRVHGAVIRERAPNPTMDVQKMFARRGEACVRGVVCGTRVGWASALGNGGHGRRTMKPPVCISVRASCRAHLERSRRRAERKALASLVSASVG